MRMIKCIEKEIIKRLDKGEKIYIESGAANDCITSYSVRTYKSQPWQSYVEKEITFTTTASIFPKLIKLTDYNNIDTEEFNGHLFLHVGD